MSSLRENPVLSLGNDGGGDGGGGGGNDGGGGGGGDDAAAAAAARAAELSARVTNLVNLLWTQHNLIYYGERNSAVLDLRLVKRAFQQRDADDFRRLLRRAQSSVNRLLRQLNEFNEKYKQVESLGPEGVRQLKESGLRGAAKASFAEAASQEEWLFKAPNTKWGLSVIIGDEGSESDEGTPMKPLVSVFYPD